MMKTKLFILICFLTLISCASRKPVIQTEQQYIEKLVPVKVPDDSALLALQLYCDSNNNVRLREIEELKSANVHSNFDLKQFPDKSATLKYKTKTVHDTVWIPAKTSTITKTITITKKVNEIYWWQKTLMYIGVIVSLFVLGKFVIKKYI